MQIKERGNKVQLLRSEYRQAQRDPNGNLVRGTGRSVQRIIGTFSRWLESPEEITAKLKVELSAEEREQLEKWLAVRAEKRKKEEKELALQTISRQMETATTAIEEGATLSEKKAQEIYDSWSVLQSALRQAGYKRKKKA